MSPMDLESSIVEILKALGKIDTKTSTLCVKVDNIKERIDKTDERISTLPCDKHTKSMMDEVNTRVSWRVFLPIIFLIMSVVITGYAYTHHVSEELTTHRITYEVNK